MLFTYSCCVAVLDSKVVSIGWETGLGRCVQPSPGRVQEQASKARASRPVSKLNVSILCVKFISKIPFNDFAFLDRYHRHLAGQRLLEYTRSRFYLIRAYAIFDLVVQTRFRVNRDYLYRCKKVKLRCKLSDTKKVSSYMISHIDIPFPKYTSIIQKYWYFFKSSF